jgi:thiol:disulfide interchange protein
MSTKSKPLTLPLLLLAVAAAAAVGWFVAKQVRLATQPASAPVAAAAEATAPVATPAQPAVELHWLTDFAVAKAQAKAEDKPLLMYFTGSDWCTACLLLDRAVFDTAQFKDYADKHLVLLELDFPMKKQLPDELVAQNQALQSTYDAGDLPTIVLLNSSGATLLVTHGARKTVTAQSFIDQIKLAASRPVMPPPATIGPAG